MRFDGVSKLLIGENPVVILTANLFSLDDSASFKISDDPLNGALRDADLRCDLAEYG